jgi:hypothetical protein
MAMRQPTSSVEPAGRATVLETWPIEKMIEPAIGWESSDTTR